MLPDEALDFYALGLSESSPALTFKVTLNDDGSPADCEIFPSRLKVTRLSYEEADSRPDLEGLFALADRNLKRRLEAGAVTIELPETHMTVKDGQVSIEPITEYRSAAMVRECMLLAGEGAARWAFQRRIPFPYVSQETGDLPASPLPGLAGSYQLRRCMRPRMLSAKPGLHQGLGLSAYSQVTSPLRRYQDLLAHQQIRAFLAGRAPVGEEELLMSLAAADAAALATVQAERASRAHWTAVYLSERKNSAWEGVIVELKGNRAVVLIPALGLETQVNAGGESNDPIVLTLLSVKIPEGEVFFTVKPD
jgi:exoribonuclease-2